MLNSHLHQKKQGCKRPLAGMSRHGICLTLGPLGSTISTQFRLWWEVVSARCCFSFEIEWNVWFAVCCWSLCLFVLLLFLFVYCALAWNFKGVKRVKKYWHHITMTVSSQNSGMMWQPFRSTKPKGLDLTLSCWRFAFTVAFGSIPVTGFILNNDTSAFGGQCKKTIWVKTNLPSTQFRLNQKVLKTQLFFSSDFGFSKAPACFFIFLKRKTEKTIQKTMDFVFGIHKTYKFCAAKIWSGPHMLCFFQCFQDQNVGNGVNHSSCFWILRDQNPLGPLSQVHLGHLA